MSSDIFAGQWKQFRGRVKEMWGKLTDDELDEIDGKRDRLIGKLQERYGYDRVRANDEVDRFLRDMDHPRHTP